MICSAQHTMFILGNFLEIAPYMYVYWKENGVWSQKSLGLNLCLHLFMTVGKLFCLFEPPPLGNEVIMSSP